MQLMEQRVFNMVVQQGLLLERDTRIFISAPTLRGLHEAVAERLGITEPFHIWMLAVQPTGSTAGDELRLVESLDQLSDASTIHLEQHPHGAASLRTSSLKLQPPQGATSSRSNIVKE